MSRSFQSVSDVLHAVIHRHGLTTRLFECQLQQRWDRIAGPQVAAHSRPEQIRFKKLYLLVENSVWLQQLRFLVPTLLETLAKAAGEPLVTDIVLRVGDIRPSPVPRAPQASASPTPPTSLPAAPDEPLRGKDEALRLPALRDPELQSRFAAIVAALSPRGSAPPASERPAP